MSFKRGVDRSAQRAGLCPGFRKIIERPLLQHARAGCLVRIAGQNHDGNVRRPVMDAFHTFGIRAAVRQPQVEQNHLNMVFFQPLQCLFQTIDVLEGNGIRVRIKRPLDPSCINQIVFN